MRGTDVDGSEQNSRWTKHRLMAALPSWLFTLVAGVSYVRCAVLARVLPGARRIRYRDKLPQKRKVLTSSPARVIGRTGNDIWLPRGCRNVSIEVTGRGNRVRIGNLTRSTGQIRIRIEGSGNVVDIEHFEIGGPADIRLSGDNGTLTIGSLWVREGLTIMNGTEIRGETAFGARCTIGKGCTAESLKIYNLHADGVVQIGDGCMIAPEVVIMNSDSHPIYDRKTGAMINRPTRPLVIGAHSWLATHAVILKGAQLAAGTVVGYNATVSGRFEEENTVLAGCPARVVRRDVDWAAYGKGFV